MKAVWNQQEEARRLSRRFENVENKAAFARAFDVPGGRSMLSQHCSGHRPIGLKAAAAYARGFGVSLAEISPRLAREVAAAEPATPRGETTTKLTTDSGADVSVVTSYHRNTVSSIPYIREELMKLEELPVEPFPALLWDDAMSPELPAGRQVEFSTKEDPIYGDKVLIRWNGKLYFRSYRESDDGKSWIGYATHRDFHDLKPERGARVVAVMTAHVVPRGVRWIGA